VPWGEIGLQGLGLVLYPGLLGACVIGFLLEVASAWALVPERGGPLPAARPVLAPARLAGDARGFPLYSLSALLLALIAALQVAAPYNPVPATDRNLLVAGFALAGAAWLLWSWGWNRGELDTGLMLTVQLCWLVAMLVPTVESETFKPQTLGNTQFNPYLAVKVASGLLYLLCLPALLHLLPESAPQGVPGGAGRRPPGLEGVGFGLLRVVLWLPYCGLFASLYFPPGGDDPLELLRFLGIVGGAAAIGVAIALNLIYRGTAFTHRFYMRVVIPFTFVTLGLGILSAVIGTR